MSRRVPAKPSCFYCPHCRSEIPLSWEALQPGERAAVVTVSCPMCGDSVRVRVRPEREAEAAR